MVRKAPKTQKQRKGHGRESLERVCFFQLLDWRLVLLLCFGYRKRIPVNFLIYLSMSEIQILYGKRKELKLTTLTAGEQPSVDHLPVALTPSVLMALLSCLWQTAPPASVSTWRSLQSRCLACVQGGTYGQPRPARPSLPQPTGTRTESHWACAIPVTQGRPSKGSCYQDSWTCFSFSPALCLEVCQNLPNIYLPFHSLSQNWLLSSITKEPGQTCDMGC